VPIYAYICAGCGTFDVARPVTEAAEPASCPECGAAASRRFTPPGLGLVATPVRRGLELEERSAHEPDIVNQRGGRPLPHRHSPTPPWVYSH
jgi:putative FmdB family regulatory protein